MESKYLYVLRTLCMYMEDANPLKRVGKTARILFVVYSGCEGCLPSRLPGTPTATNIHIIVNITRGKREKVYMRGSSPLPHPAIYKPARVTESPCHLTKREYARTHRHTHTLTGGGFDIPAAILRFD